MEKNIWVICLCFSDKLEMRRNDSMRKNVLYFNQKIKGQNPARRLLSGFDPSFLLPWKYLQNSMLSVKDDMSKALNRGSRLGPKTSVQGKPCTEAWIFATWKFYKCFSIKGEISA